MSKMLYTRTQILNKNLVLHPFIPNFNILQGAVTHTEWGVRGQNPS